MRREAEAQRQIALLRQLRDAELARRDREAAYTKHRAVAGAGGDATPARVQREKTEIDAGWAAPEPLRRETEIDADRAAPELLRREKTEIGVGGDAQPLRREAARVAGGTAASHPGTPSPRPRER